MEDKSKSPNTVWHNAVITRAMREEKNSCKSVILWFTGLSGSGKSTLAHAVEEKLFELGCSTFVYDGDNVRHGICADLTFSEDDRHENIRRIGEVTKLSIEAGIMTLAAFISPFRSDRKKIRNMVKDGDFIEIYCQCSLEVCESRDVKGLYKKARLGEIENYTGISSPYEAPEKAEIVIKTDTESLAQSVEKIVAYLVKNKYLIS